MLGLLFRGLLLGFAIWFVLKALKGRSRPGRISVQDPYEILNIPRTASYEEIRKAYLRELQAHHPDKVGQMGVEIQRVAQRRTQEIIEAYRQLTLEPL